MAANVPATIDEKRQKELNTAFTSLIASIKGGEVAAEQERAKALVQMGFDPRFHIELYENKVWINKTGAHWWASQDTRYAGITSKPIGDPELKKAYGVAADEIGVIASLWIKGQDQRPFCTGFGKASTKGYVKARDLPDGDADKRRNPLDANYTLLMAEKRAEVQAIKKFRPPSFNWEITEATDVLAETTITDVESQPTMCPKHDQRFSDDRYKGWSHLLEGEKGPKGGRVYCKWEDIQSEPQPEPQEKPQGAAEQPPEAKAVVQEDVDDWSRLQLFMGNDESEESTRVKDWFAAEGLTLHPKWILDNGERPERLSAGLLERAVQELGI